MEENHSSDMNEQIQDMPPDVSEVQAQTDEPGIPAPAEKTGGEKKPGFFRKRIQEEPVKNALVILVVYAAARLIFKGLFDLVPAGIVKDYAGQAIGIIAPLLFAAVLGYGSSFGGGLKKFGKTLLLSLPMFLAAGIGLGMTALDVADGNESWQSTSVICLGVLSLLRVGISEIAVMYGVISRSIGEENGRDQEGVWYSAIISGIFFGLLHLQYLLYSDNANEVIVRALCFIAIGIVYAAIYYRGKHLWVLMVLHGLISSIFMFRDRFVQGTSTVSFLTREDYLYLILPTIVALVHTGIILRRRKIRNAVENLCGSEAAAMLPPDKVSREEKLRARKERAARRKAQLKEQYADAPLAYRIFRIYLIRPLCLMCGAVLLLTVILLAGSEVFIGEDSIESEYERWEESGYETAERNKIEELSPIDANGAARIQAMPRGNADDTWTVCVYIVGSNLEDHYENDLSDLVYVQTRDVREDNAYMARQRTNEMIARFTDELYENGIDAPAYLYEPVKPIASSTVLTSEVVKSDRRGAASTDIYEMLTDDYGDNVNIVVQTGGARRWSETSINPNRTQRFLIKHGEMEKVSDLPIQDSCSPDTLSDFLSFCNENYHSDHNILVLWDHGGGAFGYGQDYIFNSDLSLADIRSALDKVYDADRESPAFDIIGFDACLMSTIEVVHYLDGFASYLAVSEETEPGEGWNYDPWLRALADDPGMSPAQAAMNIADSYMDYYMTLNTTTSIISILMGSNDVTFSVIDENKGCDLYDAYCELTKRQLTDAASDISVLSEIGRCGRKATRYGGEVSNIFNSADLGNYVDYMVDTYPDESTKIKNLIGEAVLYHRENGSLSDSQGIAVYLPCGVEDFDGLYYLLDYVYNICEDESTKALYYYKMTGCLSKDMQEYVKTLSDHVPAVINTAIFESFGKAAPVIDDEGFTVPVDPTLQSMTVSYYMENAIYDAGKNLQVELGYDENTYLDGEGSLCCNFDGTWICLDGVPLCTDIISSSPSSIEYRSKIMYDGTLSYLLFSFNRDTEEYVINGVSEIPYDAGNDNFITNTKSVQEVRVGSTIEPVYDVYDYNTGSEEEKCGVSIKFGKNSAVSRTILENGYYLTAAVITDQRGDKYYSKVVGHTVSHGAVSERKIDEEFFGEN